VLVLHVEVCPELTIHCADALFPLFPPTLPSSLVSCHRPRRSSLPTRILPRSGSINHEIPSSLPKARLLCPDSIGAVAERAELARAATFRGELLRYARRFAFLGPCRNVLDFWRCVASSPSSHLLHCWPLRLRCGRRGDAASNPLAAKRGSAPCIAPLLRHRLPPRTKSRECSVTRQRRGRNTPIPAASPGPRVTTRRCSACSLLFRAR
jgi:hypothetical protein